MDELMHSNDLVYLPGPDYTDGDGSSSMDYGFDVVYWCSSPSPPPTPPPPPEPPPPGEPEKRACGMCPEDARISFEICRITAKGSFGCAICRSGAREQCKECVKADNKCKNKQAMLSQCDNIGIGECHGGDDSPDDIVRSLEPLVF